MRATALATESRFPLLLVALPPFSQRRAGNAAAATDQTRIARLFIQIDPRQAFLDLIVHSSSLSVEMMFVNRTHQSVGRIMLICDNARYNHARLLKDYLTETNSRVELLFLPPYSPNLNLIERLRVFMKDRILRTYYPTFADFRHAIQNFFLNHLISMLMTYSLS